MQLRFSLLIALAFTCATFAQADSTYVVRLGDTLSEIASDHGLSLDEVVRANGINNPDLIFPGQEIRIPGAGDAAPGPNALTSGPNLSTSNTLPFVNYGSMSGSIRAISRVKIAEEVLEKLEQAPPGAIGGFQIVAQLGEVLLRAPVADRALVGGMLALIVTPYSATLASTLGTAPTFAMDAVFPAAKQAIVSVVRQTLTTYGRVGAPQLVGAALQR